MTEEHLEACKKKLKEIDLYSMKIHKINSSNSQYMLQLYPQNDTLIIEQELLNIILKYYSDKLKRLQKEFDEM